MNTKNTLLNLVIGALADCDDSVRELFTLIHEAVKSCATDDIDWYLMNDMSEGDVLLFILLNDTELFIHFNEIVLIEATHYLFGSRKISEGESYVALH
ncbi:conserved hypothetical protein [Vibrio coralliirubri]|uniref:hypothetical protein n=1 Tax=Vibrio coralliirubri TaxID=1516159 RepID=UPI000638F9BF|nr:hypothetical protein [Vibrio coralliirubri]CDT56389.1 conserved hypothetical protein [Vibrio coralliirubri]